jgi:hypothetical protein
MNPDTRAIVAAATFACLADKKVAGIHDHSTGRDLHIAAEFRGDQLQGYDGDRAVKFGGKLPEIRIGTDKSLVSFEVNGATVKGYDRGTSSFFTANVTDGVVQVFDHAEGAWFAYDVQDADAASSYHRTAGAGS